ncbi:response regulator [Crocinitomicaceae bacterium]|nr:response regulator [Crocinitomicaceae bacterium]
MSKVLLIEDDNQMRESIYEILEHRGYDVTSSENGRAGIEEAKKVVPDLIICDIMMPGIDGWQTIDIIRGIEKFENTPFIFLSAAPLVPNFRIGMNRGADDFITKPFQSCELLDVIDRLLSKRIKLTQANNERMNVALNLFKKETVNNEKDYQKSLNRAKIVQNGILPTIEKMKDMFQEHFLYYSPLQTISGDFYWTKEINGLKLIAVADCTGHGVPAALLSMACATVMNVACEMFEITSPAKALRKINELVVEFMRENYLEHDGDGMDVSFCSINQKDKTVTYSGAKRPLYFLPKHIKSLGDAEQNMRIHENGGGNKLVEFRGSSFSIGSNQFEIEEYSFSYEPGDNLYLLSDGYVSQFGGEHSKKFNSKNLKQLLLSIKGLDIEEQGVIVRNSFDLWKGEEEQTDDVTFIGITL